MSHHGVSSSSHVPGLDESKLRLSERGSPPAIVSLLPSDKKRFFTPTLWTELDHLLPNLRESMVGKTSEWDSLFATFGPEIIIACWKTALLPPEPPASLRYICYLAGSVRELVPRCYLEKGVIVSNWAGLASDTVAECALMLILASLRRLTRFTFEMHQHRGWNGTKALDTETLFGRRVGLHGFGRVAHQLVSLLKPFGVEIFAYTEGVPEETYAKQGVVRCRTLEELFDSSSIIVEIEALTPKTHRSVRESHLRRLPPKGIFVNVGRGAVVDQEALGRVAREGLLYVGLDTYESDPLPHDSPLRGLDNVTLLPHVAGPTEDRFPFVTAHALRNLRRYLKGDPLEGLITMEIYDRST